MERAVMDGCRSLGMEIWGVDLLAGDVSRRQYFRLHGPSGNWVACLYPEPFNSSVGARERWQTLCRQDPDARLSFSSDPVAYLETTGWFIRCGIPVPGLFGVVDKLGLVVMEDVGDLSLETIWSRLDRHTLGVVYDLALRYLDSLRKSTADACEQGLLACSLKLDCEKLLSELYYLLQGISLLPVTALKAVRKAALLDEWGMICEEASSEPYVLCHRDYHSRNLFLKGGRVYVLDHQDLRLGNRFYDIVSLLWDPYVELPSGFRQILLKQHGLGDSAEMAAVVAQRLLKAIGTYINVLLTKKRPTFMRATRAALRYLSDILRHGQTQNTAATQELIGDLWRVLDQFEGQTFVMDE